MGKKEEKGNKEEVKGEEKNEKKDEEKGKGKTRKIREGAHLDNAYRQGNGNVN